MVLRSIYSSVVTIIFVIFSASFREIESKLEGIPNFLDSDSEHLKSSAKTMDPSYGILRKASLKQMISSHVLCSKFIWSGNGRERKPALEHRRKTVQSIRIQVSCKFFTSVTPNFVKLTVFNLQMDWNLLTPESFWNSELVNSSVMKCCTLSLTACLLLATLTNSNRSSSEGLHNDTFSLITFNITIKIQCSSNTYEGSNTLIVTLEWQY